MTSSIPTPPSSARVRTFTLAVVLWAFGLATTTLLVGVWGRSVTSATATLSESALAALDPDVVSDQIAGWLLSETSSLPGVPKSTAETVVRGVTGSPKARIAIESVVTDVVNAAAAPAGSQTVIDVAAAIEPLRPVLIASLEQAGVDATAAEVDGFLRQIEQLVLSSVERRAPAGSIATARSTLTTVMLVGAAGLAVFGVAALRLSDDRPRMMRSLANRLIVSSLTFALFLRIGAWAVDPRGGRSPLRESGAILLASNIATVLMIAATGVIVSSAMTLGIRRVKSRRTGSSQTFDRSRGVEPISPSAPDSLPDRTPHPASVR